MKSIIPAASVVLLALTLSFAGPSFGGGENTTPADPHAKHRAMMKTPSSAERSQAQYAIPELTLINQHGERVYLPELFDTDRPVLVNFIFTDCTTICPAMASIFQQVQRRLGENAEDVLMVSVSIDPENDTPQALSEYAGRFKAGAQWQFLTGTLEDSVAVQKAFGTYRGDKMLHPPLTVIRPAPAGEWVRYEGFASVDELERECRAVL